MKKIIDINSWKRKEHFHFFNSMDDPFTGVVANIDCTKAFHQAKQNNYSFYQLYLHKSLIAANSIEPFRYRIEDEAVVCYDEVHAGATTDNDEGTFSFVFLPYFESFSEFTKVANARITETRKKGGLCFDNDQMRSDCIHYTTVPWIKFTGLKHARNSGYKGSCPKISFGQAFKENQQMLIPVSVEVNHALMDGKQLTEYYHVFQQLMNE